MESTALPDLGRPLTAWEQKSHAEMATFGEHLGNGYERIWDDPERIVTVVNMAASDEADAVLKRRPGVVVSTPWRVAHWGLFLLGFCFFIVMMIANGQPFAQGPNGNAGPVWGWATVWIAVSLVWLWSLARFDPINKKHAADGLALRKAFIDVSVGRALEILDDRRHEARTHTPSADPTLLFEPKGPMPLPQQYGVSHEGAERLVAEWMRYLGEVDAEVTRLTGDGGIDVASLHYIAQVKNYTGTVGVAEVRELGGVASVDGRKPLFFTSGNYASGSVDFADRVGMALFRYDAINGSLHEENDLAAEAFQRGL